MERVHHMYVYELKIILLKFTDIIFNDNYAMLLFYVISDISQKQHHVKLIIKKWKSIVI